MWTSGLVGLNMLKDGSEWYRLGYRFAMLEISDPEDRGPAV